MPSQALIIIIDAQVGLIENPDAPPGDRAALLDTLEALLADARRTGVPVVFVQDEDVGAGNAAPHAIHLHPRIAPRPDEAVIPKGGTSAFFRTTLEQTLHERGATRLVLAGCKTAYCIDTTARHAIGLGYQVTVVEDGHSTSDNGEFVVRVIPRDALIW